MQAASVAAALVVFVGVVIATLPPLEKPLRGHRYAQSCGAKKWALPQPQQVGETIVSSWRAVLRQRPTTRASASSSVLDPRVMAGSCLAARGRSVGFLIGMSPLGYRGLNPLIQCSSPSPAPWMPLASTRSGRADLVDLRDLHLSI